MVDHKASKISRQITLSTSFQLIHTVTHHRAFTVNVIRLTNVTGAAVTVQLCYVPDGDVAAVGNSVLWDFSVAANNFIEFGEGDIIRGATVQARASSDNAINLRLSGTEESSI